MAVGTSKSGEPSISTEFYHPKLTVSVRETVKRVLALPVDTNIVWKSHDDSIAQRSAIDEARKEKNTGGHHTSSKRRETINEDSAPEKAKVSHS